MKKKTRREEIAQFLRENPMLTPTDAGKALGITKQYVNLCQMLTPGLREEREAAKDALLEALGTKLRPFRAPEKKS
jgi:hypothetical protein